jgi:hypothetical protein
MYKKTIMLGNTLTMLTLSPRQKDVHYETLLEQAHSETAAAAEAARVATARADEVRRYPRYLSSIPAS